MYKAECQYCGNTSGISYLEFNDVPFVWTCDECKANAEANEKASPRRWSKYGSQDKVR